MSVAEWSAGGRPLLQGWAPAERDWPAVEPARLEALARACVPEFLLGFGLSDGLATRPLVAALLWRLARRFAWLSAAFDAQIEREGLPAAAGWLLRQCVAGVEVGDLDRVPAHGPLLVVANHPGLADAPALFAALRRADLRVLAADRPFLRALPHLAPHVIGVGTSEHQRRAAVRAAVAHLRAGGAVLTFPAGHIEPDPALCAAAPTTADWSPSVGLFLRRAPRTRVLAAAVSGVLNARAVANPLTRLRQREADREWLGALLQILLPAYQGVTVRVAFGAPRRSDELLAAAGSSLSRRQGAAALGRAVVELAQQQLADRPSQWQPLWPVPSLPVGARGEAATWRGRQPVLSD